MQKLHDCLERNNNLGLKLSDCSLKESVSSLKQIFCPIVFFLPLLQHSLFSTVVKMVRWVDGYVNMMIIHCFGFYLIVYTTL